MRETMVFVSLGAQRGQRRKVVPADAEVETPWTSDEKFRSEWARSTVPYLAACVQLRGDWSWRRSTLKIPSWNGGAWLCTVTVTLRMHAVWLNSGA